jgi:hypothetical protein
MLCNKADLRTYIVAINWSAVHQVLFGGVIGTIT